MTPELWVAVIVAMVGSSAGLVGTLLTRRTAAEDNTRSWWRAEVAYLADQLAEERARTDRLEVAVRECHAERDDLERRVRRLEALGGANPGGPP